MRRGLIIIITACTIGRVQSAFAADVKHHFSGYTSEVTYLNMGIPNVNTAFETMTTIEHQDANGVFLPEHEMEEQFEGHHVLFSFTHPVPLSSGEGYRFDMNVTLDGDPVLALGQVDFFGTPGNWFCFTIKNAIAWNLTKYHQNAGGSWSVDNDGTTTFTRDEHVVDSVRTVIMNRHSVLTSPP